MKSTPQFPAWQPIESAPKDERVLLWFISVNPENIYAHAVTIGQVSSFSDGMVWVNGNFHEIEIYTHWMPLPEAPE